MGRPERAQGRVARGVRRRGRHAAAPLPPPAALREPRPAHPDRPGAGARRETRGRASRGCFVRDPVGSLGLERHPRGQGRAWRVPRVRLRRARGRDVRRADRPRGDDLDPPLARRRDGGRDGAVFRPDGRRAGGGARRGGLGGARRARREPGRQAPRRGLDAVLPGERGGRAVQRRGRTRRAGRRRVLRHRAGDEPGGSVPAHGFAAGE